MVAQKKINSDKDLKIAVLGGGVSGLCAAYSLKKRGYHHVTVFERQPAVGGKVSTYFHEGQPYELGAVWLTNDYKTVIRLARELEVELMPARLVDFVKANGTQLSVFDQILKNVGPGKFLLSWVRFLKTINQFSSLKKSGFGDIDPVLFQSIEEVSAQYGFLTFTETLAAMMTGCGYGFYREIPAIYWMKLMPMITTVFINRMIPFRNGLWSVKRGFQTLWQKMASTLDIKLGTEVMRIAIHPEKNEPHIQLRTADGQSFIYDRLIIASPLETLQEIMDLSPLQQSLFSKICHLRYAITLAKAKHNIHAGVIDHITPEKINHVNFIAQYYEDRDISIFYQMLGAGISEDEAHAVLITDLEKAGVHPKEIIARKIWSYFPHVKKADLDAGFYQQLEGLQGVQGLYYTGGLLSFETVEHTAAYSERLIERFF